MNDEAQAPPTGSATQRTASGPGADAPSATGQRHGQAMAGALAGIGVIAILIGIFIWVDVADKRPDGAGQPPAAAQLDAALSTKPTVTKGAGELTQLTVTPLINGTGPRVAAGQNITVNYVGVSYRTGEEFDASWRTGQPAKFAIGVGQVIPGWDQGLVGVPVGSRVQLDIPADLAYGENPAGGRPAGPLRFVVDVLGAR